MARVELPQSKIKARKRRRRNRITAVSVIGFLILFGASVALFRAPFLRVSEVAVTGAQTLHADEIKQFVEKRIAGTYLWVYPKDDILLYPQAFIEHDLLKSYPTLKSVEVHADNFHTIGIVLHERTPAALWCGTGQQPGSCSYMDEDGIVYSPRAVTASSSFVMYLGAVTDSPVSQSARQYLTVDRFHALMSLATALSQVEQGDSLERMSIDEMGDGRAYFSSGFVLIFSGKDPSGDVFERLTLARQAAPVNGKPLSDFEYIDLRFGDKLYYKLKNQ